MMRATAAVIAAIALQVVLGACTTTGAPPPKRPIAPSPDLPFQPPTNTSGSETGVQARARLHTELAASYFEIGNMGVALEEVNAALTADRNYGPAYNVAGLVYSELREDRLAQQNFERALRLNPLDSDANNNYGRFLCDRKREAEAIKYFMAALRNPLYQNPERSYVNAGLCSRRRGDVEAAQDYFQKAVQLRANQPQALFQLAELAYARGAYQQARDYLARLTRVSTPNPETLWLGVRIERKLGDRDAVASYSTQLARNFPESKEAQALSAGRFE